jgi:hypothetical protein
MTAMTTKFMIISDTHGFQFGDAERFDGEFQLPTPKIDVLLHCGDLTSKGGVSAYEGVLRMLGNIEAELKLVIAGNHDLDLDSEYWTWRHNPGNPAYENDKKAKSVMTGPLALEAGVTYLEEGLHTFTLRSGARFTVYASPYQPEFYGWAFPYERDEDRFNPAAHVMPNVRCIAKNPVPDFPNVDIMMTHGPPKDILDWTAQGNVGCEALLRAASRARPRLYCFGHIHEAYGAKVITWKDDKSKIGADAIDSEKTELNAYPSPSSRPTQFGSKTLMVNAAIMDLRYRPTNTPWLVELELPKAV